METNFVPLNWLARAAFNLGLVCFAYPVTIERRYGVIDRRLA